MIGRGAGGRWDRTSACLVQASSESLWIGVISGARNIGCFWIHPFTRIVRPFFVSARRRVTQSSACTRRHRKRHNRAGGREHETTCRRGARDHARTHMRGTHEEMTHAPSPTPLRKTNLGSSKPMGSRGFSESVEMGLLRPTEPTAPRLVVKEFFSHRRPHPPRHAVPRCGLPLPPREEGTRDHLHNLYTDSPGVSGCQPALCNSQYSAPLQLIRSRSSLASGPESSRSFAPCPAQFAPDSPLPSACLTGDGMQTPLTSSPRRNTLRSSHRTAASSWSRWSSWKIALCRAPPTSMLPSSA